MVLRAISAPALHSITATGPQNFIVGTKGPDWITATAEGLDIRVVNHIRAGAGNDRLEVSTSSFGLSTSEAVSDLRGGKGDDLIEVETQCPVDAYSTIFGDGGNDRITLSQIGSHVSVRNQADISGGSGNDRINSYLESAETGDLYALGTVATGDQGNAPLDPSPVTPSTSATTCMAGTAMTRSLRLPKPQATCASIFAAGTETTCSPGSSLMKASQY